MLPFSIERIYRDLAWTLLYVQSWLKVPAMSWTILATLLLLRATLSRNSNNRRKQTCRHRSFHLRRLVEVRFRRLGALVVKLVINLPCVRESVCIRESHPRELSVELSVIRCP